jgi:hypothetical protein
LCKTCGCSPPDSENNDHGDSRNITHRDLVAATKTKDATAKTVAGVIRTMAKTHRLNRRKRK